MKIAEKSMLVKCGMLKSVELCEAVLKSLAENDSDGRKLNSISEINPNWYFEARALDENPDKKNNKSPLYGIPIVLKDNIDVKDMRNTAGSLALSDLIPEEDSFIARKLKEAGAIILAKSNLSEFAYWMSEDDMPSGYSSLSGQVVHPYNPKFDPSGSSSGSAVAVAARFFDVSIGTETDGSLMSPSISNGIVSIKPTVGLVSRSGIIPLSHIQDTAGPMANCVEDAAMLLQAIAGKDEKDPATLTCRKSDYTGALINNLKGKRIGVFTVEGQIHNEEYQKKLKDIILANGGEAVDVHYEKAYFDEEICLKHEFKNDINRYLKEHNSRCRSLDDIISFNNEHPEQCLKYGQTLLIASNSTTGSLKEREYIEKRIELRREADRYLNHVLKEKNLDCLVTACGHVPTNLAAISGSCSLVIPARKPDAVKYDPMSYYMLNKAYGEAELIQLAYVLQENLNIEAKPDWVK